jgi:hypothetical protein
MGVRMLKIYIGILLGFLLLASPLAATEIADEGYATVRGPRYANTLPGSQLSLPWQIPVWNLLALQYQPNRQIVYTNGTITVNGGVLLLPNGAVGAPGLAFTNDTDTGLYYDAAVIAGFGGARIFSWTGSAIFIDKRLNIRNLSGGINSGVALVTEADHSLSLLNSTNAQTLRSYNTYTDATNWERGGIEWNSNQFLVGTDSDDAGSGANDRLLGFKVGGTVWWYISATGILYPNGDDGKDIGSASNKVKELYVSRSIQGSKVKALTEGSPTSVVQIAIPDEDFFEVTFRWAVFADDGTDHQILKGEYLLVCINKDGSEACTAGSNHADISNLSTGTLTCSESIDVSGSNAVIITLDCDSSLTQTTLDAYYRLDMLNPQTVTPQ